MVVVAKGYGFYSLCILMTKSTSGTQRQLLAGIQIHHEAIGTTAFSGSVLKLAEVKWHFHTLFQVRSDTEIL